MSGGAKWSAERAYDFHVAIPTVGIVVQGFRRVSGLGTNESEYEIYREGGDNTAPHVLFNHTRNGKITLEWAIRHPDPFVIWWLTMATGMITRHPMTVTLLENRIPRAMWIIPQALISRLEFPELDALSSEVATNKVELIHNGLIPVPM